MNHKTVPEALDEILNLYNNEIVFIDRHQFHKEKWSYSKLSQKINSMLGFLQANDLQKGDKVAICAPNSPWWVVIYLACAKAGIVVIPLDFNSKNEFIDQVLTDTESKMMFISVFKHYSNKNNVLIEELDENISEYSKTVKSPDIIPNDILEIVYTSGSTGSPKGVVLTHENVMSNVSNLLEVWHKDKHETSLSLIPLSHMLEQTANLWMALSLGCTVVYINSIKPSAISEAIKEEGVTIIVTVPAFLQLLKRNVESKLQSKGLKATLGNTILKVTKYLPWQISRKVSRPIRSQIGKELETFVVGGARLPEEVEAFWNNMGFRVIQGYGLTETSPIVTYSNKQETKPKSVGKCLPNQQIRLGDDGEILIKGLNVFSGYYKNNDATNESFDKQYWFRSGDIGYIDNEGYVFLRGRIKSMLLGSDGLNVFPEDIESIILNNKIFKDAVVLMKNSEKEPKLTAVLLTDAKLKEVNNSINEINAILPSHQVIQEHYIWEQGDFPRTPTRKVKRKVIQDWLDNNKESKDTNIETDTTQLQKMIRQVSGTNKAITNELKLSSDLAIDSIKKLELVNLIEENFIISIDDSEISNRTTVKDLEALIDISRKRSNRQNVKYKNLPKNRFFKNYLSVIQAVLLSFPSIFQKIELNNIKIPDEPVIFVANHTSHYDAITFLRVAGISGRQRLAIAAASDYFFKDKFRAFLSRCLINGVAVDRNGNVRQSMSRIGNEISNGRSLLIFPEGSRSLDGELHSFKKGTGFLANQFGVEVIPVKIDGNYKILPKGSRWPKKGTTKIHAGTPMKFTITQNPDEISKLIHDALLKI